MTEANKKTASFFENYKNSYVEKEAVSMSLGEYLELCQDDKMAYANAAERLLDAIGEPKIVDTASDKGRWDEFSGGGPSRFIRRSKIFLVLRIRSKKSFLTYAARRPARNIKNRFCICWDRSVAVNHRWAIA